MTALFPLPAPRFAIALQRTRGQGRLSVKHSVGQSRIDRLFQDGAARIRLPKVASGSPVEAVMINTAGGLTGGDRMDWTFQAGEGASMSLTTQACEKTYAAQGDNETRIAVRLRLDRASSLAWLPQETILFDKARLNRRIDVDMAPDARLLMVEPVVFGRIAMGEVVTEGSFGDRWRVNLDGHLRHVENMRLGPEISDLLKTAAVSNGGLAMATVLMIAPEAEARLGPVRKIIDAFAGATGDIAGGASFVSRRGAKTGKLLARLVARDSYQLRKVLVPLVSVLNPEGSLPKVWTI